MLPHGRHMLGQQPSRTASEEWTHEDIAIVGKGGRRRVDKSDGHLSRSKSMLQPIPSAQTSDPDLVVAQCQILDPKSKAKLRQGLLKEHASKSCPSMQKDLKQTNFVLPHTSALGEAGLEVVKCVSSQKGDRKPESSGSVLQQCRRFFRGRQSTAMDASELDNNLDLQMKPSKHYSPNEAHHASHSKKSQKTELVLDARPRIFNRNRSTSLGTSMSPEPRIPRDQPDNPVQRTSLETLRSSPEPERSEIAGATRSRHRSGQQKVSGLYRRPSFGTDRRRYSLEHELHRPTRNACETQQGTDEKRRTSLDSHPIAFDITSSARPRLQDLSQQPSCHIDVILQRSSGRLSSEFRNSKPAEESRTIPRMNRMCFGDLHPVEFQVSGTEYKGTTGVANSSQASFQSASRGQSETKNCVSREATCAVTACSSRFSRGCSGHSSTYTGASHCSRASSLTARTGRHQSILGLSRQPVSESIGFTCHMSRGSSSQPSVESVKTNDVIKSGSQSQRKAQDSAVDDCRTETSSFKQPIHRSQTVTGDELGSPRICASKALQLLSAMDLSESRVSTESDSHCGLKISVEECLLVPTYDDDVESGLLAHESGCVLVSNSNQLIDMKKSAEDGAGSNTSSRRSELHCGQTTPATNTGEQFDDRITPNPMSGPDYPLPKKFSLTRTCGLRSKELRTHDDAQVGCNSRNPISRLRSSETSKRTADAFIRRPSHAGGALPSGFGNRRNSVSIMECAEGETSKITAEAADQKRKNRERPWDAKWRRTQSKLRAVAQFDALKAKMSEIGTEIEHSKQLLNRASSVVAASRDLPVSQEVNMDPHRSETCMYGGKEQKGDEVAAAKTFAARWRRKSSISSGIDPQAQKPLQSAMKRVKSAFETEAEDFDHKFETEGDDDQPLSPPSQRIIPGFGRSWVQTRRGSVVRVICEVDQSQNLPCWTSNPRLDTGNINTSDQDTNSEKTSASTVMFSLNDKHESIVSAQAQAEAFDKSKVLEGVSVGVPGQDDLLNSTNVQKLLDSPPKHPFQGDDISTSATSENLPSGEDTPKKNIRTFSTKVRLLIKNMRDHHRPKVPADEIDAIN